MTPQTPTHAPGPIPTNEVATAVGSVTGGSPPPPEAGPGGPDGWPSIPGHEILCELGRGGMGVVYKAHHRLLDRVVAAKVVLHGEHSTGEARQRFLTEARAVARLCHPHIVQIHEIGEAGPLPYFTMEFCP